MDLCLQKSVHNDHKSPVFLCSCVFCASVVLQHRPDLLQHEELSAGRQIHHRDHRPRNERTSRWNYFLLFSVNLFSSLTRLWFVCAAELDVGVKTEGFDVHSVGNTLVLHQSALIEAFNLKAAIEYQMKNGEKNLWFIKTRKDWTGLKSF